MDVTSPATATLGIWTIARFAAIAVLATEALGLYARMKDAGEWGHDARVRRGDHVPGGSVTSRFFWALTPAVLLAGLCLWCTIFVVR